MKHLLHVKSVFLIANAAVKINYMFTDGVKICIAATWQRAEGVFVRCLSVTRRMKNKVNVPNEQGQVMLLPLTERTRGRGGEKNILE